MYCPSCGTLLPTNTRVCPNCGKTNPAFDSNTESLSFEPTILAHSDRKVAEANSQPPNPASLPPAQKPARRFSRTLGILIPILILAVIGAGLLIYNGYASPTHLQHTPATAVPIMQQTRTAEAQATAAVENPYTHTGKLAFTDPLQANSAGQKWDVNTNCAFKGGAYNVIAPDPHFSDYCTANATHFSNFAFEVSMKIIQGDAGGILLRVKNTNPNQYYDFYVGQDGTYGFEIVNGSKYSILKKGTSAAIRQGLNAENVLAVVAQGNSMTLYVNHSSVGSVTDQSYDAGQIGLYAVVYSHATEVVFSNARLWAI